MVELSFRYIFIKNDINTTSGNTYNDKDRYPIYHVFYKTIIQSI